MLKNPSVFDVDIDDETVLLNEDSGQLILLNPVATALWYGISSGATPSDIAAMIARQSGASASAIEADIDETLMQWNCMGIVSMPDQETKAFTTTEPEEIYSAEQPAGLSPITVTATTMDHLALAGRFRVGDVQFDVSVSSGEARLAADRVFGHLKVDSRNQPDFALSVEHHTGQWVLFCDGEYLAYCQRETQLAPMLHAQTLLLVYQHSKMDIAIHAAAVTQQDHCIILPAKSGSGKSTLSAALLAEGFGFCSDDLVMLAGPDLKVVPASFCIGLKSGSWDIAAKRTPAVADLVTHERADGKSIRYIQPTPRSDFASQHERLSARYLVMPTYDPDCPGEIRPLTSAEALVGLTQSGYDVASQLDRELLYRLISWIKGIRCYELRYSDIDYAIDFIASLE
ncbi:MAG: PqqD family peptide modification chaperone [Gammaproteobacteria bacterium]|nr:PqqD family peptide modification chaperone [Gammaproteobacteria bacterium]